MLQVQNGGATLSLQGDEGWLDGGGANDGGEEEQEGKATQEGLKEKQVEEL